MKQYDLFALFNGDGMMAFPEEPKKERVASANVEKVEMEASEVEESEMEDDEDMGDELVEETKEPTKKSTSASKGKGNSKKGITGDTKVTLPVTCKGRNWSFIIEGFGTKSINEILKELYIAGYVEVAHKDVQPIADDKAIKNSTIYFSSPKNESRSSVAIFGTTKATTVADGMEQMPLTPEMFGGKDVEEISLLDAQEKWEQGFPLYVNQGLNYDVSSNVAVPVLEKALAKDQKITLPKEIVISGERQQIKFGMFEPVEVTCDEIRKVYFPGMDVQLKILGDTLYAEYNGKVVTGLNKPGVTKDAKEVTAKELFALPCQCYFVTLNQTFEFSPEMFGGKTKVTQEEVLELLRKTYSILRNKDRRVEVVYAKEQNLISVALTSGTKGSGYALPETEQCGLFKLIRTLEELQEIKKLANFLGIYVPENGPSQRIEVCPHAVYTATMGEGRELMRIKHVSYELKLPKIPYSLFQCIVEDFKAHPERERIVQICYDEKKEEYYLSFPSYEESSKAFIRYQFASKAPIVTIHSHNTMPAYFSHIDNRDEAITGVYGVIGTVHETPTYKFRVGMEGSFQELELTDLFLEV